MWRDIKRMPQIKLLRRIASNYRYVKVLFTIFVKMVNKDENELPKSTLAILKA